MKSFEWIYLQNACVLYEKVKQVTSVFILVGITIVSYIRVLSSLIKVDAENNKDSIY